MWEEKTTTKVKSSEGTGPVIKVQDKNVLHSQFSQGQLAFYAIRQRQTAAEKPINSSAEHADLITHFFFLLKFKAKKSECKFD